MKWALNFTSWIRPAMAIFFVLTANACSRAGIILPTVPDGDYQAYAWNFPSVGYFAATSNLGYNFGGSGVLISSSWVLTSGHSITSQPGLTELKFSVAPSTLGYPPNYVVADSWYVHPGYNAGTPVGSGTDLALVHLSTPVTSVAPATLYTGSLTTGTPVNMVGYGGLGVYPATSLTFDGIRRAGTNTIYSMGSVTLGVQPQYALTEFNPNGPLTTSLEFGLSPGDSGGGWFINDNGEMKLVAITSFEFSSYAYAGGITIGNEMAWIETTTSFAAVPEPPTWIMTMVGIPLLILISRKQARRQASTG